MKDWKTITDEKPAPHARYIVKRGEIIFTATPCYGMHAPWWVPRVPTTIPDVHVETEPLPMAGTDEWIGPIS